MRWMAALLLGLAGTAAGAERVAVSAWMPCDFDFENGFRSFYEHAGRLEALSPFWLHPLPDGSVTGYPTDPERRNAKSLAQCESIIRAVCRERGVKLLPALGEAPDRYGKGLARAIIRDPARRQAHVAAVVEWVVAHGYDGLDLDYEVLTAGDRPVFSRFVAELAAALHARAKRLTLAVHAKTAEPGDWDGSRAQDWAALGKVVDRLRIMAYDHHEDSGPPGPIAPLPWFEDVLDHARALVPREKIEMGVPSYGYDWAPNGAEEVTALGAPLLAARRKAPLAWELLPAQWRFAYDRDGVVHQVWYEDSRSLPAKLALVRAAGIAGIALWRLGAEDQGFWAELDRAP